ncbi:YqjK family protein [Aquabacterium sp.]|uniref:YqjK family protein n=1 Tax=Aquabacterium sp. TaxID=1872578 RepID=UPI0019C7CD77|nr:hypothetical protein [Aquabacterium sp.]
MSAARFQELALKKQLLQQRSAALRGSLAAQSSAALTPAFAVVDRVHEGARWLAAHPALVSGVAAGVAVVLFRRRRNGPWAWVRRAWWLWRTWRQLQPLLVGKANT